LVWLVADHNVPPYLHYWKTSCFDISHVFIDALLLFIVGKVVVGIFVGHALFLKVSLGFPAPGTGAERGSVKPFV
jgi:hypothetical protein